MARDPLDKVRKLLALATSTNVHEAAAAAARAQALIAHYRLDELLAAEESAAAEPIGDEVLEATRRRRRWKTALAAGLASVNGCLVFTRDEARLEQIVLSGRASDRAAVRSLWGWLVGQLEWLSATHGVGRDKRWHDDFRVGAAETITARLRAATQAEQDAVDPTALIRLEPALLLRARALAAYADEHLRLRSGRRLMVGVDAWRAGRSAARTVPLAGCEGAAAPKVTP